MPDSRVIELFRIVVLAVAGGVALLLAAVLCQHVWARLTAVRMRRREAVLAPPLYDLLQSSTPDSTRLGPLTAPKRSSWRPLGGHPSCCSP
ncbi:MAG: hypothetical protein ABIY46_15295 [Gemmatimonadales bacterium]